MNRIFDLTYDLTVYSQFINNYIFIIPWEFSYDLHQEINHQRKNVVESSLYCFKQWVHLINFNLMTTPIT